MNKTMSNNQSHVAISQLITLLLLLPLAATNYAQVERYVAGTHYTEISNPVNTRDASKIEVIEVFWYGCGHCFRFEPLINAWEENAPEDVDFLRFPAIWNALLQVHAQAYYTAEALDAVSLLHEHIFTAINVQGNRMQSESQIGAVFTEHGISQESFTNAFNSFSVRTKVNQAQSRTLAYEVASTPNMVVNGKYLISTGESVPTQEEMLNVVDFLVEKERAAMRDVDE
ncbi:MAG: thiol:disulfide interchange protein DsbA/DsbL [Pseudohongiellaceae bacterium]